MTDKLREQLEKSNDALEAAAAELDRLHEENESLKTRLAQPEPRVTEDMWKKLSELQQKVMEIAHTAPPKKEWVGLTYADLYFWGGELGLGELGKGVLRAVDVHLREKNSGYVSTKKEWVGLTDEDKRKVCEMTERDDRGYVMAIVEAMLKEKNNG